MTTTLPRATVEQALHVAENAGYPLALIKALRAALAQQAEPEPVAWVRLEAWKSGKEWPDDCFTALPAEGLTPLYTAPQQRKPLTEEEINEIAQTNLGDYRDGEWHLLFARAVERAHGIKE